MRRQLAAASTARNAASRGERRNGSPSPIALYAMIEMRGRTPVAAANARARSASARASSSPSLTPASSVTAHIGARPGRARVLGGRVEHVVELVALGDRHHAPAVRRDRARHREPEPHVRRLAREPADAGRQARGADGDRARVDAERARLGAARAIAASTASRFASGSPMPWNTTPWTRPRGRRARTTRTCSTISHAARLRARPSRPVAQNAQASAQPTCELTHTREAVRVLERDPHRLEPRAVAAREQVLHERIELARGLGDDLERGHVRRPRAPRRPRRGGSAELAAIGSPRWTCGDQLARLGRASPPGTAAVKRSGVMA